MQTPLLKDKVQMKRAEDSGDAWADADIHNFP